jgi:hypothetical protein
VVALRIASNSSRASNFFLSCAQDDRRNDPHWRIDSFFEQLVREIRDQTGIAEDEIGFLATKDIPTGTAWSEELVEALLTCRAFVPILSPTYFLSQYAARSGRRSAVAFRRHGVPS